VAANAGDKVYGRQWCDFLNKNAFSRSLKLASDCEVTTSAGRLFYRRGATAPKAWSPAVLSLVLQLRLVPG